MNNLRLVPFEAEEQFQAPRRAYVVVHYEYLARRTGWSRFCPPWSGRGQVGRMMLGGSRGAGLPDGQSDSELTSLVKSRTARLDTSIVHLDQAAHEGQSQAQTALRM